METAPAAAAKAISPAAPIVGLGGLKNLLLSGHGNNGVGDGDEKQRVRAHVHSVPATSPPSAALFNRDAWANGRLKYQPGVFPNTQSIESPLAASLVQRPFATAAAAAEEGEREGEVADDARAQGTSLSARVDELEALVASMEGEVAAREEAEAREKVLEARLESAEFQIESLTRELRIAREGRAEAESELEALRAHSMTAHRDLFSAMVLNAKLALLAAGAPEALRCTLTASELAELAEAQHVAMPQWGRWIAAQLLAAPLEEGEEEEDEEEDEEDKEEAA